MVRTLLLMFRLSPNTTPSVRRTRRIVLGVLLAALALDFISLELHESAIKSFVLSTLGFERGWGFATDLSFAGPGPTLLVRRTDGGWVVHWAPALTAVDAKRPVWSPSDYAVSYEAFEWRRGLWAPTSSELTNRSAMWHWGRGWSVPAFRSPGDAATRGEVREAVLAFLADPSSEAALSPGVELDRAAMARAVRLRGWTEMRPLWWGYAHTAAAGVMLALALWLLAVEAWADTAGVYRWFRDQIRGERVARGLCAYCKYDVGELIRDPDARCPECGREVWRRSGAEA